MRLTILALLATVAISPAFAQQVSPMTGTTSTAPVAPPVTAASPATGSATTTATPAAHRHRMTAHQRFEAANTTKDGKLTLDQAKAGHMTRVVNNFDAMDSAKKGYVSEEDIRAYNRAQRAAHRAAAAKPAAQ